MEIQAVYGAETRSWLLKKFALGTKNYWFAFVADAVSAIYFLSWEFWNNSTSPYIIAMSVIGGYLLWTITEYVFHRWVYHQEEGIFGEGHRIHHVKAQTLIAMPWFMTTAVVFGLWYLISMIFAVPLFSSILSGWLAGFVFYSLVHHSHHHWNLGFSWFRKLKAYHRIHHHFPEYNYGVTMRFWDVFFGTRYRKTAIKSMQDLYAKERNYGNIESIEEVQKERLMVLKS